MGVIKSGTNRRIVSFMLTCIMTLSLVLSIAGQGTVVAYASQTGTITGSGVRVRSTPTTSVSNNILTSLKYIYRITHIETGKYIIRNTCCRGTSHTYTTSGYSSRL